MKIEPYTHNILWLVSAFRDRGQSSALSLPLTHAPWRLGGSYLSLHFASRVRLSLHLGFCSSLLGFCSSPCGFVSPWVRLSLCVPCARGSHSSTSYTPCTQAAPPHPSVHPPRIVAGHIAAGHMLPIVHRFEGCAHASGAPPLPSKPLASCRALAVPSMARSTPPPPTGLHGTRGES